MADPQESSITTSTMGRKSRLTEGSCLYCRKRRLRCDLGRPRCSRCLQSDSDCLYGTNVQLKWVGGMASRGQLARYSSSDTGSDHGSRTRQSSSTTTPTFTPKPIPSALQDSDLIAYFSDAVLPRFQIYEKTVQLDFDAVLQDQTLQQAILAVAKAHYALNSKTVNSDIVLVRRRARHTAIESFRHLLEAEISQERTAQQLFTINVLLCVLDGIIEPSDETNASVCHLRGGFAILSQWRNTCGRILIEGGMQAHLLSIFVTMDLMHALLKGEKPFFQAVTWLMFANTPTWFGSLPPDDAFLTILKAYSELACFGSVIHDSTSHEDGLQVVDRCLSSIEPVFRVSTRAECEDSTGDLSATYWKIFCSIYQICGTIYIERALRLKSIDHEAVQAAVRRGVEMLVDNVLPGMLNHCLVFPILVIGTHCIHSQDKRAVIEALSPTSSYLSFGSIHLMTDFMRKAWDKLEMDTLWWECFEPISGTAFLF